MKRKTSKKTTIPGSNIKTHPLHKKSNGIVVSCLEGIDFDFNKAGQGEYAWVPKSWIKSIIYDSTGKVFEVHLKNGLKYGQFGAKATDKTPQETIISYLGKGNAEEVVILWAEHTDNELIEHFGDAERVEKTCVRPALLKAVGQKEGGALTEVYKCSTLTQFKDIRKNSLYPKKRNEELKEYLTKLNILTSEEYELHSDVDLFLPKLNQLNSDEWSYFQPLSTKDYLTHKNVRSKKDNTITNFTKCADETRRHELNKQLEQMSCRNDIFEFIKKHSRGWSTNLAKETDLFINDRYKWVKDNRVTIQGQADAEYCINTYLEIFGEKRVSRVEGFDRIYKEDGKENVYHILFRPTEQGYTQMNAVRTFDEVKQLIEKSTEKICIVIHDGIGKIKTVDISNKYIKWPYNDLFNSDKHFALTADNYVKLC